MADPVRLDDDDAIFGVVPGAIAGEAIAIRRFLEGIAPWVRRTCVAVLGSSHSELEDSIQECLVSALKALPGYRYEGHLRPYVAKIALRIAIANRRSWIAWKQRHASIAEAQAAENVAPGDSEWSAKDVALVRRILDQVPGVQSEALFMRIVLGFSVDEIAAMTGVSPNTVKTRLRLGKNSLRGDGRTPPFWRSWLSEKLG